jgi:hypothetical protein
MKQRLLISPLAPLALGALIITGCGGAEELDDARAHAAELTNKLQEAQTRISELEQTVQTALTNYVLAQNDLASLSNRFVKVKAELGEAQGRWSIAEATANQRAARIAELEGQAQQTVHLITELRQENARIAAKAEQANSEILQADARRQTAVNERELLKARIIELEQLMNNAEWLRSQYRRVKSAPTAPSPSTLDTSKPTGEPPPTTRRDEAEATAVLILPRFRDMMVPTARTAPYPKFPIKTDPEADVREATPPPKE